MSGSSPPDNPHVDPSPIASVPPGHLPRAVRRRAVVASILRSLFIATAGFVLYFTLPLDAASDPNTGVALAVGLVAVALLIAWQAWAITRSPFPLIRAVEGLVTSFPMVVLLFATTYFVMGQYQAGSFTESMSRLDAIYFTVTTFATVGYGDITPLTESARATATVQMVVDLALVGFVVRAFARSVRTGLARREDLTQVSP